MSDAEGPSKDEVEEVLFYFLQRGFIGTVPQDAATVADARWVRETLVDLAVLTPQDVAAWPPGKQLALYELLRDLLIMLRLRPPSRFPPGELDGSSAQQLSQPLLSGLARAPLTIFPR